LCKRQASGRRTPALGCDGFRPSACSILQSTRRRIAPLLAHGDGVSRSIYCTQSVPRRPHMHSVLHASGAQPHDTAAGLSPRAESQVQQSTAGVAGQKSARFCVFWSGRGTASDDIRMMLTGSDAAGALRRSPSEVLRMMTNTE